MNRRHHHHEHDRDDLDEREILLAILLVLEDISAAIAYAILPPEPATATLTFQGDPPMSDITVPITQDTLTATVTYEDVDADIVNPVSPPVWSSSDESIATVDASADPTGMTAAVTLLHAAGSATIDAATTNSDGTVVTGSGTITVEAAPVLEPATGDVTFA